MKKLVVLCAALVLVVLSVGPAFADRGSGGGDRDRSGQQSGPGGGEREQEREERDQDRDDDPEQEQEREQERSRDGDDDAQQQQERERAQRFDLEGQIVAIDLATGAITVAVSDANKPDGPVMQQVTVRAVAGTQLQRKAGSLWVRATLGDYRVGQTIIARGTIGAGSWTAARIRVGAKP